MCEKFVCKYLNAKVLQRLPEICFELENCEICPYMILIGRQYLPKGEELPKDGDLSKRAA